MSDVSRTGDRAAATSQPESPAAHRVGWGFILLYTLAYLGTSLVLIASAPNVPVVLIGWCIAQLMFNALLAAMVAVLPDQVPTAQRGLVSGVLGVCLPVASVGGTYMVQLFTGNQLAMFLVPCAVGGFFVLLFALTLDDRRLARSEKPAWSLRELAGTFYVSPRRNPDFAR